MILTSWPTTKVNSNFYAYSEKAKDNAVITEFLSGRTVAYKTNERGIMQLSCSLMLDRTTDEASDFWEWYNDSLGGLAGVFTCSALGSAYYRFTSTPEPQDTDQRILTLSLNIEEVY